MFSLSFSHKHFKRTRQRNQVGYGQGTGRNFRQARNWMGAEPSEQLLHGGRINQQYTDFLGAQILDKIITPDNSCGSWSLPRRPTPYPLSWSGYGENRILSVWPDRHSEYRTCASVAFHHDQVRHSAGLVPACPSKGREQTGNHVSGAAIFHEILKYFVDVTLGRE
jgi:hypothetical protein